MCATTLTIPAEHRDAFRLAAVYEVQFCGEWIEQMAGEMPRYLNADGSDLDPAADVRGAYRHVGYAMDVLDAALAAPKRGSLEVSGEAVTLAHVGESMADKILPPRLREAMEVAPFTQTQAEQVHRLTDSMAWAAGMAASMHVKAQAEVDGGAA